MQEIRSSKKFIAAFSYDNGNTYVSSEIYAVAKDILRIDDDVTEITQA